MSNVITGFEFGAVTTAEMVAAIMESALRNRCYEGTFGRVGSAPLKAPGTWKVEVADERGVFYCRHINSRWTVEHDGFVGEDADLECAARLITGNA